MVKEVKEQIEKWKPKLDDKIKALNSSRVFKKITPKGDLSWYIKWASSIIIIFGMMLSSANIYPMNIWVHLFGVSGWMIVGMLWHDRALIFLNGVAIFVFASGLVNHYYG
jgi:hypothetical protein|tara:strand:+ start:361 stop:690 length:330 start_codon:yes stop_codon:yes gene_type:complete